MRFQHLLIHVDVACMEALLNTMDRHLVQAALFDTKLLLLLLNN